MDNEEISIKMNHSRIQELGLNNAAVSQQILNSIEGIKIPPWIQMNFKTWEYQ